MSDITLEVGENNKPECKFTGLTNCLKQEANEPIDTELCKVCILGKIEQHLFNATNILGKMLDNQSKD